MDPTKFRMRYLLVFLAAAALTAAALRHLLHVQAGFTREEILYGCFDNRWHRNLSHHRLLPIEAPSVSHIPR